MSDSDNESVTSEAPEPPDTDDAASSVGGDDNAPEVTSADSGGTSGGPENTKAADKDATTVMPIVTGGPGAQPKMPPETLTGTPMSRASPSPDATTVSRERRDSVMSRHTGDSSGNQRSIPIWTHSNAPSRSRSTSPNSVQSTSPATPSGSLVSQKPSENTTQGSSGTTSGNSAGENTAPGGPTREKQAMLPPMPLPDFRSVDHLFAYMKMIDPHDDGKTVVALIKRLEKEEGGGRSPQTQDEKADKDKSAEFILLVEKVPATRRMFMGIDPEAEDDDGTMTAERSPPSSDVSDSTDKSSDSASTQGDKQSTKASSGQTRSSKARESKGPSGRFGALLAWMSAQDVVRNAKVDSSTTNA